MTLNLTFPDKMCPNMALFHQIFCPNMAREKRHAGRTHLPLLGPSTPPRAFRYGMQMARGGGVLDPKKGRCVRPARRFSRAILGKKI